MKYFCALMCLTSALFAEMNEPKISVQNRLLAKVNDQALSVVDVMKKMDLLMHQNYPQYADSPQARFQFYSTNWRHIFMEMVDTELMLSDAQEREIQLSDGDVREEIESRFGPNVMATLDKIGLSYEDAWKMTHDELIMRRMMWFFVHSKASESVSPQEIRNAYHQYVAENPSFQEWVYRVVSIRTEDDAAPDIEGIHQFLLVANQSPEQITVLKDWESKHPSTKIQISNEYTAKDLELSESHKSALSALTPGSYSSPISQVSRTDNKTVYRIFYLSAKNDHPAPAFETIANKLKEELIHKATVKESESYLQKLRKHYGFDALSLKETVPDDLEPFRLE